jgi:hypothetical protein
MNDTQWWMCGAPDAILRWLGSKTDRRCLRLFACACCRLIWPLIPNGPSRRAVEISDHFADGLVSAADLQEAEAQARSVHALGTGAWLAAWAATEAAGIDAETAAAWVPTWAAEAAGEAAARAALASKDSIPVDDLGSAAWRQQRQLQSALLRDIFHSPSRLSVQIDPSCLVWKNGAVVKAAQACYNRGGSEDLSHLAQLLEQAGCDQEDILEHCQAASGHVRGCWVLDLLLGKRGTPGHVQNVLKLASGARAPWLEKRLSRGSRRAPPRVGTVGARVIQRIGVLLRRAAGVGGAGRQPVSSTFPALRKCESATCLNS